jgi:hypothetical protein
MYRLVPRGLRDAGPNPQPALPQRLHFSSSSSSLLRTYCFWPRLRCTELGRIRFSSFSPGASLNQSPGSLFGSPAASFWRPLGFASPPHDGFAFLAALLRKMRLLVLLSASRASHANIISESQCLEAGLPLFTELPRRVIPGNPPSPGPIGPGSSGPYPLYRTGCERYSASFREHSFSETQPCSV